LIVVLLDILNALQDILYWF